MKRGLGLSNKEMGDVFTKWNKGVLDSFLIEITRDIMYFNDDDGKPLVEKILDQAGQKGTGKWTAVNALDLGMPVTLIAEAVLARCLSAIKPERVEASTKLQYVSRSSGKFEGNKEQFLEDLEQALYASKIISYAQGFMLMQEVRISFPAPQTPSSLPCLSFVLQITVSSAILTRIVLTTRPPETLAGSSTNPPLLSCGVVAASSAPSS